MIENKVQLRWWPDPALVGRILLNLSSYNVLRSRKVQGSAKLLFPGFDIFPPVFAYVLFVPELAFIILATWAL